MSVLDRLILRDDRWDRMSPHIIGDETTRGSSGRDNRMALPAGNGPFQNGAAGAPAHVAFDSSLSRINCYNQGSSEGGYTVRGGETLSSIAANL